MISQYAVVALVVVAAILATLAAPHLVRRLPAYRRMMEEKARLEKKHAQHAAEFRNEMAATRAEIAADQELDERALQRTPRQLSIAKSGIAATARVIAAKPTNTTINQLRLFEVELEIEKPAPAGAAAGRLELRVCLSAVGAFACRPGSTVEVRLDPANPADAVLVV